MNEYAKNSFSFKTMYSDSSQRVKTWVIVPDVDMVLNVREIHHQLPANFIGSGEPFLNNRSNLDIFVMDKCDFEPTTHPLPHNHMWGHVRVMYSDLTANKEAPFKIYKESVSVVGTIRSINSQANLSESEITRLKPQIASLKIKKNKCYVVHFYHEGVPYIDGDGNELWPGFLVLRGTIAY